MAKTCKKREMQDLHHHILPEAAASLAVNDILMTWDMVSQQEGTVLSARPGLRSPRSYRVGCTCHTRDGFVVKHS